MADPFDVLVVYVPRPRRTWCWPPSSRRAPVPSGTTTSARSWRPAAASSGRFARRARRVGAVGELEHVDEDRVEVVLPRRLRAEVVAALRRAHPYEEPAFHVIATAEVE